MTKNHIFVPRDRSLTDFEANLLDKVLNQTAELARLNRLVRDTASSHLESGRLARTQLRERDATIAAIDCDRAAWRKLAVERGDHPASKEYAADYADASDYGHPWLPSLDGWLAQRGNRQQAAKAKQAVEPPIEKECNHPWPCPSNLSFLRRGFMNGRPE